nr:alcohol dehydrogenase catalytic domain-containing protein [Frankia gtarii]
MKAATWHGRRDVRVQDVPDPRIEEPTDAIVRITTTNICGSDLHLYEVLGAFMREGDILGHEPMGIVEEVGPEVTSLKAGDRVVVPFQLAGRRRVGAVVGQRVKPVLFHEECFQGFTFAGGAGLHDPQGRRAWRWRLHAGNRNATRSERRPCPAGHPSTGTACRGVRRVSRSAGAGGRCGGGPRR